MRDFLQSLVIAREGRRHPRLALPVRLALQVVVEERLHLEGRLRIQRVAEDPAEIHLPGSDLLFQREGELRSKLLIDRDASLHALENRPEELLLEAVHLDEAELLEVLRRRLSALASPHTVNGVVPPELILGDVLLPGLAVVLPVDVVVAIHRRLEGERLRQPAERRVVGDHRVLGDMRDEVPVAVGILAVVEEVLASDPDVRVG